MAEVRAAGQAAVLAIKAKFVRAILAGQKLVEFRKSRFCREVSHVFIYESQGAGRVVACFEVAYIDEGRPEELWQRYGAVGGISREEFFRYYGLRRSGVAIGVRNLQLLPAPTRLEDLGCNPRPPQSFCYIQPQVALSTAAN